MSELNAILSAYESVEKRLQLDNNGSRVTYSALVNFNGAMIKPRHRWYPYKEGYSPQFVREFLKNNSSGPIRVIDPFSGVGTTVIEAALMGNSGVGVEVNPLANFIAKTKAAQISPDELKYLESCRKNFARSLLRVAVPPPENDTVTSYFQPEYLDALLRVKGYILKIDPGPVRDLFLLALLSAIEPFSTHRKAGNGVKRKTRLAYPTLDGSPIDQVRAHLGRLVKIYHDDILELPGPLDAKFVLGNSLELDIDEIGSSFDCVLTSPPYLNCFDYSKIYMCELWLGDFFRSADDQRRFRMGSVRSHVHARWPARYEDKGSQIVKELIYPTLFSKELWSKQIPDTIRGYFMDLGHLLETLHPILKPGSPLGIVVSNSVYGGIPIATDLLIAEIAPIHGYKAERIEVYRGIVPSSQQYVQLASKYYLREGTVILRKV
jgi:hypothetical protein